MPTLTMTGLPDSIRLMFFRNNTKLPIWTPPEGSDVYGDNEAGFYTTKRQ